MNYTKMLLVDDKYLDAERIESDFANFVAPKVPRLTGPPRHTKLVNEIILHESVTRNRPITIGVLKRRRLGIHYIVDQFGKITQHGDLVLDQLAHAGRMHNRQSIGIEIVNPYYPEYNIGGPWDTVIDARWAHKRQYVVPTPDQIESVYQLVKRLLEIKLERFNVPTRWIGLDPKTKRLAMARVTRARFPIAGVMAHTAFGHADGAWPLLYCILREQGDAPWAYERAVKLGATSRWFVNLNGIL